jgi:hypothetical protein
MYIHTYVYVFVCICIYINIYPELDTDLLGREAGSDPYLVVNTDPPCILVEQVKSKTVIHNINPIWGDVLEIGNMYIYIYIHIYVYIYVYYIYVKEI